MHFTKAEIVVGVTKSGNALWRVAELAQGHAVTHTDRTQMQTSRTLNVAAPHLRVNPPIHIRPLTLYEERNSCVRNWLCSCWSQQSLGRRCQGA